MVKKAQAGVKAAAAVKEPLSAVLTQTLTTVPQQALGAMPSSHSINQAVHHLAACTPVDS